MRELIPQLKLKLSKRISVCLSKGYISSMRPDNPALSYPTPYAILLKRAGLCPYLKAGNGARTRVGSLEGYCTTTVLCPRLSLSVILNLQVNKSHSQAFPNFS